MDLDESGVMGVEELYSWMNGKMERAKKSRSVNFTMRGRSARPLDEVDWTPEELRIELQTLLIECGLAPLDLLRGWDTGGDGCFNKREVGAAPVDPLSCCCLSCPTRFELRLHWLAYCRSSSS
jgi:hypothetical protein